MNRLHVLSGLPGYLLVGLLVGSVLTGVILAYGLGLISMSSNREDIHFHNILNGTGTDGFGFGQPANFVLNDEGNWSRVYSQAFGYACSNPCIPPFVNFTSRTVIAVFLGHTPDGYRVRIDSVTKSGLGLAVNFEVLEPTCQVPIMATYPFDIVDVPKTNLHVSFVTHNGTEKC